MVHPACAVVPVDDPAAVPVGIVHCRASGDGSSPVACRAVHHPSDHPCSLAFLGIAVEPREGISKL